MLTVKNVKVLRIETAGRSGPNFYLERDALRRLLSEFKDDVESGRCRISTDLSDKVDATDVIRHLLEKEIRERMRAMKQSCPVSSNMHRWTVQAVCVPDAEDPMSLGSWEVRMWFHGRRFFLDDTGIDDSDDGEHGQLEGSRTGFPPKTEEPGAPMTTIKRLRMHVVDAVCRSYKDIAHVVCGEFEDDLATGKVQITGSESVVADGIETEVRRRLKDATGSKWIVEATEWKDDAWDVRMWVAAEPPEECRNQSSKDSIKMRIQLVGDMYEVAEESNGFGAVWNQSDSDVTGIDTSMPPRMFPSFDEALAWAKKEAPWLPLFESRLQRVRELASGKEDLDPDSLRVIFGIPPSTSVRITHLPTGIVAMSEDKKSQHANRANAMATLRGLIMADAVKRVGEEDSRWDLRAASYNLLDGWKSGSLKKVVQECPRCHFRDRYSVKCDPATGVSKMARCILCRREFRGWGHVADDPAYAAGRDLSDAIRKKVLAGETGDGALVAYDTNRSELFRIYNKVVDKLRNHRAQPGWIAEDDREDLEMAEDLFGLLDPEEQDRANREGWRSWPERYDEHMMGLVENPKLESDGIGPARDHATLRSDSCDDWQIRHDAGLDYL